MEYQDKYRLYNIKQVSVENERQLLEYIEILRDAICNSDVVYMYRAHNHIKVEHQLIEWAKNCGKPIEQIEIFIECFGKGLVLKAVDNGDVIALRIDEQCIKEEFTKRFFVCCSDFKHCISPEICKLGVVTMEPIYDQYDYVFVKGEKIVLWTSMHELMAFINEEWIDEKEK